MTEQEEIEYLRLLELEHKQRAIDNLNDYCRYIEIPSAPMVEDSCPDGDDCDNPDCDKHEVSNAFYPITVEPAQHHQLLNDTLMKIERKEVDPETGYTFNRLMVFMPPGSAKSTYASVTFPTWYMGRNPNKNIITTSYGSALAKKFGRKCRTITSSERYANLFDAKLLTDNRAVDDWALTNGSTFMCGGILSGITGNRADGLVVDDPVKGREDAESATIRDKTWEAYLNDLRTRLKPNGWIAIIQTRWHEDDLSGRILPDHWNGESGWVMSKQGEPWFVICLQAQCELEGDPLGRNIGDWLWTDWFTPEHWEREKRVQGSRNWEALYQQRPKPLDGSIFKRSWVNRYSTPPAEFLRVTFSLDTAYKPNEVNDPSVLTIWGETQRGHYLLAVWRDRVEYPELKRVLANYYLNWKPDAVLIEDKSSGQSLIQECRAGVQLEGLPKLINMPVVAIEPEGSKLERAISVSSMIEAGLIHIPETAPWLIDFESEFFGYPLSTHDDQVDGVTQYLRWARSRTITLSSDQLGRTRAGIEAERSGGLGFSLSRRADKFGGY